MVNLLRLIISINLLSFQESDIKAQRFPAKLDLISNINDDVPPPLPKSPPPLDNGNPQQRLDRLVNGNGGIESDLRFLSSAMRNGDQNQTISVPVQKKVSWNDNVESAVEPESPKTPNGNTNGGGGFTLQDIDEVLGSPVEPEESNFAATNTPNVIGAQEVYRDPRERIKLEKMRNQTKPTVQGPEKLSFKEKMKMFAMEQGGGGGDVSDNQNKSRNSKREADPEEANKEQQVPASNSS